MSKDHTPGKHRAIILVDGRVQGVWYRKFVCNHAEPLDLTGWVSNIPGGQVKIDVEGLKKDIEELVRDLRVGPPFSKVKDVTIEWLPFEGQFSHFETRY